MRKAIEAPGRWDDLRAGFRWRVPERFNIAAAACDDWARRDPARLAIRHLRDEGAEDWTYGRLKGASDRLARAFAARGVARGDRVAVLLPQCPEVMVTHFAAMKLGAIVLPLFTLFGSDALRFRLGDAGAKLAVTDPENLDKLAALAPDLAALRHIVVTGPRPPAPWLGLEDEIARASADPVPANTAADDPAVLIYTSGTTGPPKGALHAHRFLIGHLPSVELHHEFFPQPGDVGWTPADWAWIGGLMDLAMPCLCHGVPLVSRRFRKFDPGEAFALIREERIRNLFLPPTALKLMRQARVPAGLSIRSIGSGGESLGPDLHAWGREALGAPINEIYGQTECNLVISTCHGAMDPKPGTMGRAVPGHDVAILGVDGEPLPPGEVGEICVRAPDPVMFLGYWNRPGATAEKVKNGWLRTGDLGTCDDAGYFTFVSRDDDVITSAGYRIGPTEIETCLAGDPDVVMAAAVGLPDPVRTEAVTGFVTLRPGAEQAGLEARLIARVREQVSAHAAPRRIVILKDLPMTATGKIRRGALRDAWSGGA